MTPAGLYDQGVKERSRVWLLRAGGVPEDFWIKGYKTHGWTRVCSLHTFIDLCQFHSHVGTPGGSMMLVLCPDLFSLCMCVCMHVHERARVCAWMCVCMHDSTCMCTCMFVFMCMHTCICACVHGLEHNPNLTLTLAFGSITWTFRLLELESLKGPWVGLTQCLEAV